MTVRIRLALDAECEDCTAEQARRVELSMAQFQEGLEACIASKLTSEQPGLRVRFGYEDDDAGEAWK